MRCQYYFDFLCDIKSHYTSKLLPHNLPFLDIGLLVSTNAYLMHFQVEVIGYYPKVAAAFLQKIEIYWAFYAVYIHNTFAPWAMYQLIYRESVQFVSVRHSWNPSNSHLLSHFLSVCDSVPKFNHYILSSMILQTEWGRVSWYAQSFFISLFFQKSIWTFFKYIYKFTQF